jgi:predicted MFS family arabinose efflux permease
MKKNQQERNANGLVPAAASSNRLSRKQLLLLATACGAAVANVYYAQPLLDTMGSTFHIPPARLGVMVTCTQLGYAAGLLLLVPLGDLVNARRLITVQLLLLAVCLVITGIAQTPAVLITGLVGVGLLAVVTQTMVAYAARLAGTAERGRVVGTVTGGIVTGLLLARTVAGALADIAGWRSVYLVSSVLLTALAIVLFYLLPPPTPPTANTGSYRQLLYSLFSLFAGRRILQMRGLLAMLIFGAGQVLWTPMVLPLSAPPLSLSHTQVGLLGLAGAAGALGAAKAGRLADRGYAQWATVTGLLLLLVSWLPVAFLQQSLVALVIGIILFDMGIQVVHVTNQAVILQVVPEAASRITAGYMLFYAAGSACGSVAATAVYDRAGWIGVCLLGAAICLLALLCWFMTRENAAGRTAVCTG